MKIKVKVTKRQIFQSIAFLIALFCLKNALMIVWLLYGICLFVLWLLFRQRLMFLSALLLTAVLVFFAMPQVLSAMHYTLGTVNRLLFVPKPVLLYDGKMKEKPVISIIMPAYNYESYVEKALDSAAQQDFALPFEVVVVEDASKDKTLDVLLKIAEKYKHVRIYANIKNQGVITTKNSAIGLARGEWIYNLDADDWIDQEALSHLYRTLKDSRADAVYSWFVFEGAKHGVKALCMDGMTFSENCVPNCLLYRKSDWKKSGGYSYLLTKGMEDWAFWLKMAEHGVKIVRAQLPVYHYLIKEKSRQDSLNNNGYFKTWWMIQAWFAGRYDWNLRVLLGYTGFDSDKIGNFSALLKQMEIARFKNLKQ